MIYRRSVRFELANNAQQKVEVADPKAASNAESSSEGDVDSESSGANSGGGTVRSTSRLHQAASQILNNQRNDTNAS